MITFCNWSLVWWWMLLLLKVEGEEEEEYNFWRMWLDLLTNCIVLLREEEVMKEDTDECVVEFGLVVIKAAVVVVVKILWKCIV